MESKIYFDLSTLARTSAGSSVHAWELCHRLMRIAKPLQVIPFTSPFKTEGKVGLSRAFNGILRDVIWHNLLAGMEATQQDYFIFPNPSVPQKFYTFKYAVFVHDLGNWHNASNLRWRGKLTTRKLPQVLKNADRIFAVSDYTAQDISDEFKISRERIIIAPNGLSEIYKSIAEKVKSINNIPIPSHYFLHVGTFEPKKNLSFLIEVYERFRETIGANGTCFKLILTGGEAWKSQNFLQQIQESFYTKDILILGRVNNEELPSLYRSATALIFPSVFEGFGLPVIEALSQGTPVLINANTSLTQFGKFGATVIDNFEVDVWVKKLKEVIKTKRIDLTYISRVRNYFDWDKTAKIIGENIGLLNS